MEEKTTKNLNVLLLGLATCLTFASFDTTINIQTIIIEKAQNETSTGYVEGFGGNGFLALAFAGATFLNRLSQPVNSLVGLKWTLVAVAGLFASFVASFLHLNDILLYVASVLVGLGNAIYWPTQV